MQRLASVLALFVALYVLPIPVRAREAPKLPELPLLKITEFPPETRQQVEQIYTAARAHPNDAVAVGKLAMLLDDYDHTDAAIVCYRRAQKLQPRVFSWPYLLGVLYFRRQRHSEAVAPLQAALRLKPSYLSAQLKLAESLRKTGRLEESERVYKEVVRGHPASPEARYGQGEIERARGNAEAAAESFRQACALYPRYGVAHYALALVYQRQKKGEEAEREMELYRDNRNLEPRERDPLVEQLLKLDLSFGSLLRRAAMFDQTGRLEEAIAAEEHLLEIDPQAMLAHIALIALYGKTGNFEKAEAHYRAVIETNPTQFPKAYYNYGVLLMKNGRNQEAAREFRQVLRLDPENAEAHNNLGWLLELEGNVGEAVAEYRQAVQMKAEMQEAHFNLGRLLVKQQQYEEGIQELTKALAPANENTAQYLYVLGAAYARRGDRENALRYLREAREQATRRGQTQLLAQIQQGLQALETEAGASPK